MFDSTLGQIFRIENSLLFSRSITVYVTEKLFSEFRLLYSEKPGTSVFEFLYTMQ